LVLALLGSVPSFHRRPCRHFPAPSTAASSSPATSVSIPIPVPVAATPASAARLVSGPTAGIVIAVPTSSARHGLQKGVLLLPCKATLTKLDLERLGSSTDSKVTTAPALSIAVLDGTVGARYKRSRRCAPGVRSEGRGEDGSMSSQVHAGPQNFAEGGAPSSSRGGDASG
ncbi:hypothetical protein THAOC_21881, partial [Thalassiosira oceanica]